MSGKDSVDRQGTAAEKAEGDLLAFPVRDGDAVGGGDFDLAQLGIEDPEFAGAVLQAELLFFGHFGHGVRWRQDFDYQIWRAAQVTFRVYLVPTLLGDVSDVGDAILIFRKRPEGHFNVYNTHVSGGSLQELAHSALE